MWAREGVSRKTARYLRERFLLELCLFVRFVQSVPFPEKRGSLLLLCGDSKSWRMNNNSRYVSSQGASVSAGIKIPETSTAASRMESSYSGKVTSKHRRACFIFQQPENILGGGRKAGGVILTAAVRQLIAGWHLFTQVRKPGKQCTTKNWIVELCVQTLYYRCYFKSRSKHTFTLIC